MEKSYKLINARTGKDVGIIKSNMDEALVREVAGGLGYHIQQVEVFSFGTSDKDRTRAAIWLTDVLTEKFGAAR